MPKFSVPAFWMGTKDTLFNENLDTTFYLSSLEQVEAEVVVNVKPLWTGLDALAFFQTAP